MKIFKLSTAEMQKIYSRPGIFIMAFLFILTIVASAFIYQVPNRANGIVTIPGSTVEDIYTYYSNQANYESKQSYDNLLVSITDTINAYSITSTPIEDLNTALDSIHSQYTSYSVSINTSAPDAQVDIIKHNLKATITAFKDLYNNIYGQDYSKILVSEKNHVTLLQFLNTCEATIVDTDEADNTVILNNLNALDFLNVIQNKINAIETFIVDANIINSLNTNYLTKTNQRLLQINEQITTFNTNKSISEAKADLEAIKKLISNYKLTIKEFEVVALNSIYLNAFKNYSNEKVNTYVGFEDTSLYELQENLTRNLYLFEEEDFIYNYANSFSVSSPSNVTVNAFDFAYFTLELFSFIIIVYVVVLGAGMIAGEESNGTMKLLAIRPYKRYKIFLGKLLAALRVGFMFLIIGAMASILTGSYLFGASSLPVLSIFNAEYVIVLSPYLLFATYLLTLFTEILFYLVIAISISSIFKSYTGAVTVSILIYFVSMILAFVTGANWLKYVPLTNTNLFKYFGASFITKFGAGLNSLLTPPIMNDTDFVFSATILGVTAIVFLVVALRVFSKRDLR